MTLTAADRYGITRARKLAALEGIDAICKHTGQDDAGDALAVAFGAAQQVLSSLAALAERLAGQCPVCGHPSHPETPMECARCPEGYCEAKR